MPAHSSLRHPKKTLMKASSFDVLRQMSFDRESAINGSTSASLLNQDNAPRRPASSSNLAAQTTKGGEHESSLAFQVGNANGDDVFTDQSASELGCRDTRSKGTGESTEETSTESGDQASQRDGDWALVPREPLQIDAQNIYPSSACVFVANLTQAFDDQRLEIEVTKYFSQFGTVFVKIRRDSRQMPFAFCQFTCDADAESAGKYGNGAVILGRPCRVEKATAHSCFIVYKLSGAETSRQEAIDLLGILGPVARVYPLDPDSQKTGKLPPAMVVHYKRYDSSRSVVKTFEGHPIFCVDAYDPKAETRQQHKRSDQQSYEQYEKDRRSAYFGNLPLTMTADVLKTLASSCGEVLRGEVATKEVPQTGGKTATTCFGFIEFMRPDSIDNAIMNYHRKPIDGHIIKVERKRTRTFNGPSYSTNSSRRGPFPGASSTWRAGRGGNRNSNGNQVMNANTFIPPATGPPTTHLPPGAEHQGNGTIPPSTDDGIHRISQTIARQYVQPTAVRSVLSEEASATPVQQFPTAFSRSSNSQPSVLGYGKETEIGRVVEGKSIKCKDAMGERNLISDTPDKNVTDGPKSAATVTQTPRKAELGADDNCQGKSNEHPYESTDSKSIHSETKDGWKNVETPTKPSMRADIKTPLEYGAESATSCFYPIIPPYPYSPYGFHPIQPFMANPMTPQGGPIVYNSFGQAYYSSTPYSDMYTMYPMMQQYPHAHLETPTRPSTSSHSIENRQEESRKEPYGMSPKSGTNSDGKGKGKAH
ncbi:hypothetical protein V8C37DRAFT_417321 [Trichoderma ceciliae]